jgi:hypothetical protein
MIRRRQQFAFCDETSDSNRESRLAIPYYFVLLLLVFLPGGLRAQTTNSFYQYPGTKRMAALLDKIAREANPAQEPFLNAKRAEMLGSQLARSDANDVAKHFDLMAKFTIELLNCGKNDEALAQLDRSEKFLSSRNQLKDRQKTWLQHSRAIAYLRMAEFDNCLSNHTTDSCLLPIREGGVHKFQNGSRNVIKVLSSQLAEFPTDLTARWLINIAYMTVGDYPGRVPPSILIPPKVFASDYELPRFKDVAGNVGLDIDGLAGGAIVDDFDNDGNLDLMASDSEIRGQLRYFRNNGDGTFTERTKEAGLMGEIGGLNIIQADYNNDGNMDLLVLRGAWLGKGGHHPRSLLRNNGNGTFDDVTEEAGLLSFHPTQTATWFDFNNDGLLDLFVGYESAPGDIDHPCELFRNNGNGTFTECAATAGIAYVGFVKAVISGDFNNDGRPDLFISVRHRPKVLFRNDGPREPSQGVNSAWKFTDVAAEAGVTQPTNSFSTLFWDYNNDGWEDIFVAGYYINDVSDVAADYLGLPTTAERSHLYRNNRDGTFTDVSHEAHLDKVLLAMGINFGDLDNDGYLDLYLGTGNPVLNTLIPNRMFRNAEGKFFQDVTTSGGFGHLQKGHGIAFADIDNDGDQDVFEKMGGAVEADHYRSVLYENPGNGNNWIKLKLIGVKSNRAAIGARIKVTVETIEGTRTVYRTVSSGGSFGGNPLRQEIGLGRARSVPQVQVHWPASGIIQTFTNLSPDHLYQIREGEPEPLLVQLKAFKFSTKASQMGGAHHHHSTQ